MRRPSWNRPKPRGGRGGSWRGSGRHGGASERPPALDHSAGTREGVAGIPLHVVDRRYRMGRPVVILHGLAQTVLGHLRQWTLSGSPSSSFRSASPS
jgi:hypothetical protein